MKDLAKNTLVLNLMGGPGTGKSTHAAGIFYRMKRRGINCEYIQEYAKDKTWEEDHENAEREINFTKKCQPYVTSKQWYRIVRLLGKVDVVVTDSPIITGMLYQGFGCTPSWEKWVLETFAEFNNLNIFLIRDGESHPYNPMGRSQTEEQAMEIDVKTRAILDDNNIPYVTVKVSPTGEFNWDDAGLDAIFELLKPKLVEIKARKAAEKAARIASAKNDGFISWMLSLFGYKK
jgi:thymidylate kinase